MLPSDLLNEGMRDRWFREAAESELQAVTYNLPRANIQVIIGEDPALMSNEVGYYIERITETLDLMVVFTTKSNKRPRGHYYQRDSLSNRERPMIVLYHDEEPKDLIKRKILATRNSLGYTLTDFENVLKKRENTFVHEYIHHLDKLRMGPYKQRPAPDDDDTPDEGERKWREHYNSPLEINAYIQSMASAITQNTRSNPQNWPDDQQQFMYRAMKFVEQNYPLAWAYFDDDTKRRVQKRIYQLWLDIRGSG